VSAPLIPFYAFIAEYRDVSPFRDVPYMPSFVLPLEDVSKSLCNIKDFLFLPGFNNPTIAFLYEPKPTWTGRLQSHKDTFHVEIRTLDVLSKTYASLSSVSGLPSDCQYMLACATSIGGLIVVTSTAIIHVDQSGRRVVTSVNGWYSMITTLPADRSEEGRKVELGGSGAVWIDDKNLLLSLRGGKTMQIRLELEGRAVHRLSLLDHNVGDVTPVTNIIKIGARGVFVASAVGDSELYQIELEQYKVEAGEQLDTKVEDDLDMDLDEGKFWNQ
jgi:cleavage and polyadenylation specificity factor subunit 1